MVINSLKNETPLETKIETLLTQSYNLMVVAKKNQLLREGELDTFKISNSLIQPAHYPEDIAQHMSWVVIAIAVETLINAAFFAGVNGLIVGAIISLGVSGVNLGISFIGGWLFRGKNSLRISQKIQAWTIFIICWSLISIINFLTAAYRSASAELLFKNLDDNPLKAIVNNQFDAFGQALTNIAGILDGRFPFSDLNGPILLFIGLLAAVIGMWKGYGLDDAHPKYGAITRSASSASKKYNDLEQSLIIDTRTVADQQLQKITDIRQGTTSIRQQIVSCRIEVHNLKKEWQQKYNQMINEYQSIINVYRKSVMSVKPNDAPEYFHDEPVALIAQYDLNNSLVELEKQITELQIKIDGVIAQDLPVLSNYEDNIIKEKSTLLGKFVMVHINHIEKTARNSI